jgi:hypothetical protein
MPAWRGVRPLKRWRWLGFFASEVMLCAAEVAIGPLRQRFWAATRPDGTLLEGSSPRSGALLAACGESLGRARLRLRAPRLEVDLELDGPAGPPGIDVLSPTARGYAWTRKQAGIPARGVVALDGRPGPAEGAAVLDDSAGHHDRRTAWRWSAGMGRGAGGERLAWNLVDGVHDAPGASERAVWIDGVPVEVGPVEFAADLSAIGFSEGGELRARTWAERRSRTNLLLVRSTIRQPFAAFAGTLPGGLELAEGYGVMEEHDARW